MFYVSIKIKKYLGEEKMLEKISAKINAYKNNPNKKLSSNQRILLTGSAAMGVIEGIDKFVNTKTVLSNNINDTKNAIKELNKTDNKKVLKDLEKKLKKANFKALRSGLFGFVKGAAGFALVAVVVSALLNNIQNAKKQNEANLNQQEIQEPVEEAAAEQPETKPVAIEAKQEPNEPSPNNEIAEIKELAKA